MRTPLAVLVQTNNVPRLRHLAMSVSSGKTKQSRRPPNVDNGKRRAATLAEGNEFWRRGHERKESQSGLRYWMNPASEFLSIGDAPPTAIGHASGKRQLQPRKTRDHRFRRLAQDRQHRVCAKRHRYARSSRNPIQPGLPMAQARRFSCSRELICDIRIGPRENSPASAFRVNPRR